MLAVTSIKKNLSITIATRNAAIIEPETMKLKLGGRQAYCNVIDINTYEKQLRKLVRFYCCFM